MIAKSAVFTALFIEQHKIHELIEKLPKKRNLYSPLYVLYPIKVSILLI